MAETSSPSVSAIAKPRGGALANAALVVVGISIVFSLPLLVFMLAMIAPNVEHNLDWLTQPPWASILGISIYFGPMIGVLGDILALVGTSLAVVSLVRKAAPRRSTIAMVLSMVVLIFSLIAFVVAALEMTGSVMSI
jgi:hypothetical protein